MMYKCENCGHLFEEGEQAVWEEKHGFDYGPYEERRGCPMCMGDYEELHQCKGCDEWHADDEMYDDWCEECLRQTIDYDTFFEYCEAYKDERYLDIFVMSELLGDMDCPEYVSLEFHQLMVDTYKNKVLLAKSFPETDSFIKTCIRFIMDDDGCMGKEQYAEWLNRREVK